MISEVVVDATGETPAEPALSAPEAAAGLDVEISDVADAELAESVTELEAGDQATLPTGPLRQMILDALTDADEPLSVTRIIAELPPGVSRNTAESAIRRAREAGEIERVAPGVYALAKTKPAEKPKPEPASAPSAEEQKVEQEREAALERDAARKRETRRRDAEAGLARQRVADRQLRNQLTEVCAGNFTPGPGIDDVPPIRRAMELGVGLPNILLAIRCEHSLASCPQNQPASSWRSPALLRRIATIYTRSVIVPSMVAAMQAVRAAQKPASASEASAAGQVYVTVFGAHW